MTRADAVLLDALRLGMRGKRLEEDPELTAEDWSFLMRRADEQDVLPLVFEAVYRCPSFGALDKEERKTFQSRAVEIAIRQIVQTNEFLNLVLQAQAEGLDPVVLKGITVRSLYPLSMLRPSVDEDLLVRQNEAEAWHRFFLDEGLDPDDKEPDFTTADELSYHKPNSPTYIELHMSLFPPDSEAYGDCNALFADALDRTTTVQVEDVTLRALAPTEHLLYLLCHAYKHFLHSGVGIRQVCDMGMFVDRYGAEIDWSRVLDGCRSVRIERFSAGLFRIQELYFGFELPAAFSRIRVDASDLLEDMISGGLYGVNDVNRAHSSTITLEAVASQKKGRRSAGPLASVFLPLRSMEQKFPYLKKHPWLLPIAWVQRIWRYLFRKKSKSEHVDPGESVRIGSERVKLLKEYGILDP